MDGLKYLKQMAELNKACQSGPFYYANQADNYMDHDTRTFAGVPQMQTVLSGGTGAVGGNIMYSRDTKPATTYSSDQISALLTKQKR